MRWTDIFSQGDALTRGVALALLAMSVASWVVILWKAWLLQRAGRDVGRATAAFWQAPTLGDARDRVAAFDREALVLPLIIINAQEAIRAVPTEAAITPTMISARASATL